MGSGGRNNREYYSPSYESSALWGWWALEGGILLTKLRVLSTVRVMGSGGRNNREYYSPSYESSAPLGGDGLWRAEYYSPSYESSAPWGWWALEGGILLTKLRVLSTMRVMGSGGRNITHQVTSPQHREGDGLWRAGLWNIGLRHDCSAIKDNKITALL